MDTTILIYFGVLGTIALLALKAPAAAVGAYICTYGLEQWAQSQSNFFYTNNRLTNFVTIGVMLFALAVRQVRGVNLFAGGMPRSFWIFIALMCWAVLSCMWTVIGPSGGFGVIVGNAPYLFTAAVIMPLLIRDSGELRTALVTTMLLGGGIVVMLLLTATWTGRSIQFGSAGYGSIRGASGNPLAIASLGGWVALIALLCNFQGVGKLIQYARYPLVGLGIAMTIQASSRGQLFALLVAAIAFLPLSRGLKSVRGVFVAGVGVLTILGLAYLLFDLLVGEGNTRWDPQEMMNTFRASRLEMAWILISAWIDEGPLAWVIGLGTSASFDNDILFGSYPHVVAAEVLGELGFIGFALFSGFVLAVLLNSAKLARVFGESPAARGAAAAAGSLFLYEFILSFKQGSLLGSPFLFGFGIIVGRTMAAAAAGRDTALNAAVGVRPVFTMVSPPEAPRRPAPEPAMPEPERVFA
jgi:hypothetical protein